MALQMKIKMNSFIRSLVHILRSLYCSERICMLFLTNPQSTWPFIVSLKPNNPRLKKRNWRLLFDVSSLPGNLSNNFEGLWRPMLHLWIILVNSASSHMRGRGAVMYARLLTGRVITFVFHCPGWLLSFVSITAEMLPWPSSLFNKWKAFPPEWAAETVP